MSAGASDVKTMNIKTITATLLATLTLAGCFDSDEECYTYDAHGATWGTCDSWTGSVETIDEAGVDKLLDSGVMSPSGPIDGADCYEIGGEDLLCTLDLGPFTAVGRPAWQLADPVEDPDGLCADFSGPWETSYWSDSDQNCRVIFADAELVVGLDPID